MMTTTTNVMDFKYYYDPEPMEIDATYIAEETIDMDIEELSASKKRRSTDIETHHEEEESLCPPSKKSRGRKFIKAKRPQRQVKVVPVLLYIMF